MSCILHIIVRRETINIPVAYSICLKTTINGIRYSSVGFLETVRPVISKFSIFSFVLIVYSNCKFNIRMSGHLSTISKGGGLNIK